MQILWFVIYVVKLRVRTLKLLIRMDRKVAFDAIIIDFLIDTIESGIISAYYRKAWYPESLYLLAMVDYVSRINNVPLCADYNEIRKTKLKDPVYPSGVLVTSRIFRDESVLDRARAESIPEFMRFNIVEADIRNII